MSWSIRCRANSFVDVFSRNFLSANNVARNRNNGQAAAGYRPSSTSTASTIDTRNASTAEEPHVLEQTHGDVALIGINRPHVRNCVNLATGAALRAALERFDADDGLKSAVLYGVGGNFCAGFDLTELSTLEVEKVKEDGDNSDATSLGAIFAQRAITDPLFRPMGPSKMWLNKVGCRRYVRCVFLCHASSIPKKCIRRFP